MSATAPPRVGLVLGAGGVAGHSFHAGVLRALAEAGWDARDAEVVVGTSAGSIVGVALRAGLSPGDLHARATGGPLSDEGARILGGVPTGDARSRFAPGRARRVPRPASPRLVAALARRPWRARPGLVTAGLFPEGRVAATPIAEDVDGVLARAGEPAGLWVVTVDLDSGRRLVFGRDEALPQGWRWPDAVAASCAIPGFFTPVRVDGTRLVDGGAHSPTNADLLADVPLDAVVVASPMSATRQARRRGLDGPVRALYARRLASELAELRHLGLPVLVFEPPTDVTRRVGLRAMSPDVRVPVAHAAYETALRRLDASPDEMLPLLAPRAA